VLLLACFTRPDAADGGGGRSRLAKLAIGAAIVLSGSGAVASGSEYNLRGNPATSPAAGAQLLETTMTTTTRSLMSDDFPANETVAAPELVTAEVCDALADTVGSEHVISVPQQMPQPYYEAKYGVAQITPGAFVSPETGEEVAAVLELARAKHIPVVMRSLSGHSHAGRSTVDGGIVVWMNRFQNIEIDSVRQEATIGAGVQLGKLYAVLAANTPSFVFPGGTCATVGATGLIQGGGVGLMTNMFGYSSDNLISAKIVVFKQGRYQEVEATDVNEHSDLLFALRGGMGGNFGAVTEMKVRVFAKPSAVVEYKFARTGDYAEEMLSGLQIQASQLASTPNAKHRMRVKAKPHSVEFHGMCWCEPATAAAATDCKGCYELAKNVSAPMYGWANAAVSVWNSSTDESLFNSCLGAVDVLQSKGGEAAGDWCVNHFNWTEDTYARKSLYATHAILNSSNNMQTLVKALTQNNSDGHGFLYMDLVGGQAMHSEVPNAFLHRDNMWSVSTAEGSDEWASWAFGVLSRASFSNGESYQNFIDAELPDWFTRYFPDAQVRARLQQVKCKYNPQNAFGTTHVAHMSVPMPAVCDHQG